MPQVTRCRSPVLPLLAVCLLGCAGRGRPVPAGPQVAWTFEPVERGAVVAAPLVTERHVYVGVIHDVGLSTSGAVYCLDRQTGRQVWRFDHDGAMQHMYSSPCLAEGRLYIGEGMHANFVCTFYCLDAATGRKLWTRETAGHIESSPCVADGKVYFASGDDGVYCLDAATGAECWHYRGPVHVDASPAVVAGRLYAGSGVSRTCKTTEAFCLDAARGAVVWRTATDLPVWGSPAVDGDAVFFGLGNGRLIRSAEPPEKPAGALLCLDARTGAQRWRHDVPDAVLTRPALDATGVVFGCRDGHCYGLEPTGQLRWQQAIGSPVVTAPALLEGRVYVVASGGQVCCLERASGVPRWRFDIATHSQTRPQCFSSPVAVAEPGGGRRLLFGTELRGPLNSAAVVYCLQD